VEDMCYEKRRAEACVDESAHHALVNEREIVGERRRGRRRGARKGACTGAANMPQPCVFYYCRTYYKAVRVGGGGVPCVCLLLQDLLPRH
jgi:hypothetical protein